MFGQPTTTSTMTFSNLISPPRPMQVTQTRIKLKDIERKYERKIRKHKSRKKREGKDVTTLPPSLDVRDTGGLGSSRLCAEVGRASPPPPCGVSDGGSGMILCCVRRWRSGADMGVMRLRVEAAVGTRAPLSDAWRPTCCAARVVSCCDPVAVYRDMFCLVVWCVVFGTCVRDVTGLTGVSRAFCLPRAVWCCVPPACSAGVVVRRCDGVLVLGRVFVVVVCDVSPGDVVFYVWVGCLQ
ncbi:hypothetical protein E2C01_065769 [Portunus trituberculatus]|uniref:Uncharacterized protein n=1 Tax=Portunus trituberculatus TaxID=210409 RepID=A0A5B7HFG9_PORTR|nr:hypothetical protein [Portunus trituberculatus]